MISQNKLKQYLLYDHETGYFTWRWVNGKSHVKAGDIAGHYNRKRGYWIIRIEGKEYPAHKLAWLYWYGTYPVTGAISHKTDDRANNSLENLVLNNPERE